jgi:hypothetical protein
VREWRRDRLWEALWGRNFPTLRTCSRNPNSGSKKMCSRREFLRRIRASLTSCLRYNLAFLLALDCMWYVDSLSGRFCCRFVNQERITFLKLIAERKYPLIVLCISMLAMVCFMCGCWRRKLNVSSVVLFTIFLSHFGYRPLGMGFPWSHYNSKVIEVNGAELQKLRVNCQKLQLQNWNLAQSNSHMLTVCLVFA